MKKLFIYTIMCFLYITLTATTCDDDGSSVTHLYCTFTNESEGEVYLVTYYNAKPNQCVTVESVFEKIRSRDRMTKVLPRDSCGFSIICPNDARKALNSTYLFIFKKETLDKYTDAELVEKGICDKIYRFTYDDALAMGSLITYTGNDDK